MRKRVTDWFNWIANRELAFLAILSPILLLSELAPRGAVLALVAVVLLCLLHRVARGKLAIGAQIDVPVAALLVMLAISMGVSADWSLSFPKFCVMVLSVAVFYALVHNVQARAQIRIGFWVFALIGAALSILSLVSTDWFQSKIFSSAIYGALPRLVHNVPRSSRGGFHPNEVGGTLIMFVPIYVSLLLASRHRRTGDGEVALPGPTGIAQALLSVFDRVAAPLLGIGLALIVLTTVLTQSRAALLALAVALMAMVATRRRVILVTLPAALVLGVMWMQTLDRGDKLSLSTSPSRLPGETITEVLSTADRVTAVARQAETASWPGRIEMWANALQACRDYPFSGVGLANFPTVSRANYVYEQVPLQFNMAHAHSLYLQTAMDFGIPGVLAFLWLVLSVISAIGNVLRHGGDEATRWLGTGLLGGILSYLVFGLFDAIPLGAKPSIAFWVMAAFAITLSRQLGYRGMRWRIPRPVNLARGHVLTLTLLFLLAVAVAGRAALHTLFLNLGAVALDRTQLQAGLTENLQDRIQAVEYSLLRAISFGDSVGARRRLGVAYATMGRDEQAILEWQHDGAATRFLQQQARWSFLRGDLLAAARYYGLAIRLDPASMGSYYGLAVLHESQGRQEEALAVYDQALEMGPAVTDTAVMSQIHYRRAGILSQQGRWPEALEGNRAAVQLSQDVAAYRVALARALYRVEQDVAGAEAQLKMAMELDPTYHWSHTVLSEVYRMEGRYAEALVAADTAAGIAPQDPWPPVFTGEVYLTTQAYDSAIRVFEQAVSFDAQHPYPHYCLGKAYWAVGRREEAIQEYETATNLAPGVAYLERALERARQETEVTAPGEDREDQ